MREKQPSIEERILDIEMKMAETGPWPADFPATSGELGVRIRAVVREMDRESSSRTREWAKQAIMSICIDQYMRKSSSPSSGRRNAEKALEGLYRDHGDPYLTPEAQAAIEQAEAHLAAANQPAEEIRK